MPNALRIPVNFAHAVKRDSMDLSLEISKPEGLWASRGKGYFLQRHQNDSIFGPIIISQLEISLGELGVPSDAVEELVDWDHTLLKVSLNPSWCLADFEPSLERLASRL